MTKQANKQYEQRRIEEGVEKLTIWIPQGTKPEFKLMAEFCVENRNHVPYMVRNLVNGQFKKIE
jgi:hypothetical protein